MPLLRYEVWADCFVKDEPDPANPGQTHSVANLHGFIVKHRRRKRAEDSARFHARQEGWAFLHDRKTGTITKIEPKGR